MSVTKEELRELIVDKIKDKRPDLDAEMVADDVLSLKFINENTYEIFMKNAGLLEK